MAAKISVLFIDDNEEILNGHIEYFADEENISVVTASDGMQACKLAMNQNFNIICTDFRMPKMNGAELIETVRHYPNHRHTPFVVISGYIEEATKACSIYSNVILLAKPIKILTLLQLIEKLAKNNKFIK
jgi:CheY-like chemotaxis protein